MLLPEATTNIPSNWKFRFTPGHFGLLMPLSQQDKREISVSGGMVDQDYHSEIELHLHNGGRKRYVCTTADPVGHLLMLLCPVIKVNGKLQKPNTGSAKGTDSPRMKVCVTRTIKQPSFFNCPYIDFQQMV